MDTFLSYYVIGSTLTILGQLCIWIFCILLLIRERSLGSILLAVGGTLYTMTWPLEIFLQVIFAQKGPELLLEYKGIVHLITAVFFLIFTIGLVMLFLKYFRAAKQLREQSGTEKRN